MKNPKVQDTLIGLLKKHKIYSSNILPVPLSEDNTFNLDLSISNFELLNINITDNEVFNKYLAKKKLASKDRIPIGGYDEKRILYSKSDHFGRGKESRDIHLGIDIWVDAGTAISSPLDATVHSYANNTNYRDYGPTIILEHKLEGINFYSLYGHLSLESLDGLRIGRIIKKGEVFASVGTSDINGSWPPHLHLQLIMDIGDNRGDFPGVTSEKERSYYLRICPDPSAILGLTVN